MIVFLKGILSLKMPSWVELDVNGVGYGLTVPLSTFDRLPALGEAIHLYTYLHVREDQLSLFGFHSPSEREMFVLLLSVSGIGPKTASTFLSALREEDIHEAILQGDSKRLSSVPGIGKKTAERLILDLRDKMKKRIAPHRIRSDSKSDPEKQYAEDAISALQTLGYSLLEARKSVQTVLSTNAPDTLENLIRAALNLLLKK
jgi:Holliday junction DNA helicase RuvA